MNASENSSDLSDRIVRWPLYSVAVGVASFSTIALELALTRIFSVTMYYHFAFMVVAIAMLGLSISGVGIYLFPNIFRESRTSTLSCGFMLAFAVLAVVALSTAISSPIGPTQWRENLGRLTRLYLTSGAALCASGFAISLAISGARARIGRIYAYDLAGAALGCLAVIPCMSLLTGPGAVIATAATGSLAAGLFAIAGRPADRPFRWTRPVLVVVSGLLFLSLSYIALTEQTAQRLGRVRNPGKFWGTGRCCSKSGTPFLR